MLTCFRQERASEQYRNNSVNGLLLLNTNTAHQNQSYRSEILLGKKAQYCLTPSRECDYTVEHL